MNKSLGFQISKMTGIQKAFHAPGLPDGGREMTPLVVIDDTIRKGEAGHEFVVYVFKADLRQAVIEAEQRGDPRVLKSDAGLLDSGRIRRGLAEYLYPDHDWAGTTDETDGRPGWTGPRPEDGTRMVKSKATDVVARAERAYNIDLRKAARDLDNLVERVKNG